MGSYVYICINTHTYIEIERERERKKERKTTYVCVCEREREREQKLGVYLSIGHTVYAYIFQNEYVHTEIYFFFLDIYFVLTQPF